MLDITALTKYVDENKMALINKAVNSAKTQKFIGIQPGIKDSATINVLTPTIAFGDGSACGFNDTSKVTVSQRKIQTGQIKINATFCDKELKSTFLGINANIASGKEKLSQEGAFVNSIVEGIGATNEKAIWQGDTASADANLNKYDGFLKLMGADATVIDVAGTLPMKFIEDVYTAIPSTEMDKAVIFAGYDMVKAYVLAVNASSTATTITLGKDGSVNVLGSNTRLQAVAGLNGTNKVVAANPDELVYGCDLEGDEEKFDFWYSRDDQTFKLAINFNAGVNYPFGEQIVLGTFTEA